MDERISRIAAVTTASPSLVEVIRASLRNSIAQGVLPPGYRLTEVSLARHFGCSTTPVREAIRKLESEGLVRIYPRRGAVVMAFDLTEVENLYELRTVLETHIAREAAKQRHARVDLVEVRTLIKDQGEQLSRGSDAVTPLDAEIHRAIAVLGGNPAIAEIVENATRQIEAVQARFQVRVEDQGPSHRAHLEIIDAIARGDAGAAESLMRSHLIQAADMVLSRLRAVEPSPSVSRETP